MGERFTAPEGALRSNCGLLAGTVIRELRMHPCIDDELEDGCWNFSPEYLEFTILSASKYEYQCRYSGETGAFLWFMWDEQPDHGFLEDGFTPVRFYVKEAPLPPPYEGKPSFSPYGLRCAEIDEAVLLLRDPDAFAVAAAEPELSRRDAGVALERPSKKFLQQGGCPFYLGVDQRTIA